MVRGSRQHWLLLAGTTLVSAGTSLALAGPNGGTVVNGSAGIQGQGSNAVTINQSSQNVIINWQTFNIGRGESTTFNQPNSAAVALNRVVGGQGPSFLDGTLSANGRVFIVNGDGILFGPHSSITTAGFLATTNDIRNADFMAGKYNFNIPGNPAASIVNLGNITATSGGFAALVAPGVRNSGTITATLGTVALAAGNAFTLDFYGDKLITLAVNDQIARQVIDVETGKPLKSLVGNDGKLSANGGRVELTAAAARVVVDSVINTSGVIEANSVGAKNGKIVLSAATGSSKPTGAPAQAIRLSGRISAAGKDKGSKGGTIVVSGANIVLAGASIDASGDAGGGHVLIGGDTGGGHPSAAAASIELARLESFVIPTAATVSVDAATVINAAAGSSGNGGKVVLWSDQQTTFAGTILAQGGASGGNGGFVETSSHTVDFTGARVSTAAPNGTSGAWLIDPTNLTINTAAAATISSNLASSNVIVTTNADGTTSGPGTTSPGAGDIDVLGSISWSSSNTLTLSAFHDIIFNESGRISNTGAGNLILRADNTGLGSGTVNFFEANQVSLAAGTTSIYYNPTCAISLCNKYQSPLDFARHVSGQLTAYMLVNNAGDLGLVSGNLGGTYALGRNVDATGFGGFQAVGTTFTGLFDGNGGLGTNYTISNLNLTAPSNGGRGNSFGLFPFLSGTVRNLNLANINISGGDNLYFLGTVAGDNSGTISNVHVLSGSVNGLSFVGVGAGGLVGQNEANGLIMGSSANVTVTVGDAASQNQLNFAGGLVGSNLGTISGSSASGNVSGGALSFVGGLVGQNGIGGDGATIMSSLANGAVTGAEVGGLVGLNDGGSITVSFATGDVVGTASAPGVGAAGGLVGVNAGGSIASSHAAGNVSADANSAVGGLIGASEGGLISSSFATGNVSGGANSSVGGFVGTSVGDSITSSSATGNVSSGANSSVGGFGGVLVSDVFQSFATGSVSGGSGSSVGGFGGVNLGMISQVFATGSVTGGDHSAVGGLVGVNGAATVGKSLAVVGSIVNSYATGPASGGANSVVAGLAAVNDGAIATSYAAGAVSGGNGASTGGLVAQSNSAFQVLGMDFAGAPGTVTNSYWDTQTSGQQTSDGGTGLTTQQLAAGLPPGFDPNVWTILPDPSFPFFPWQPASTIPTVVLPPAPPSNPPAQPLVINNLTNGLTLVSLPPPVNVLPNPPLPTPPAGPQPGGPQPSGPPRLIAVPPPGETRFVKDEVVLMVDCDTPQSTLATVAREMRLTILAQQCLTQTHLNLLRLHIDNGRSIADVIRGLARYRIVAVAQANFIYLLMQEQPAQSPAPDPDLAGRNQEGDAAQYALGKLGLTDVHRLVKGANVSIAVIDSQIDVRHPDLDGVFADQYDAVGQAEAPHPHGTGMAGAIAAHQRLMGIAPAARLFAVHAFSSGSASSESTTYSILKGLDWAASKGVRVINMSFAGPRDPSIERALKMAHDKGIVLIAAAGNAGPKSPPLFPGADPNVIAVTATDADDKLFNGANRGKYIAVAAPGVDILVPAPEGTYQLTTGTSVSSAEVSGIAALLLERNPGLTPEDIRKILTSSAKHPGSKERDDDYGSGLVDPSKAIEDAGALKAVRPAKR